MGTRYGAATRLAAGLFQGLVLVALLLSTGCKRRPQRAADMNLDDERVQRALRARFAGAKLDLDEVVVTPDAIFNDEQLLEVEL